MAKTAKIEIRLTEGEMGDIRAIGKEFKVTRPEVIRVGLRVLCKMLELKKVRIK